MRNMGTYAHQRTRHAITAAAGWRPGGGGSGGNSTGGRLSGDKRVPSGDGRLHGSIYTDRPGCGDYCSYGKVGVWSGDIATNEALREMLKAVSYKNEASLQGVAAQRRTNAMSCLCTPEQAGRRRSPRTCNTSTRAHADHLGAERQFAPRTEHRAQHYRPGSHTPVHPRSCAGECCERQGTRAHTQGMSMLLGSCLLAPTALHACNVCRRRATRSPRPSRKTPAVCGTPLRKFPRCLPTDVAMAPTRVDGEAGGASPRCAPAGLRVSCGALGAAQDGGCAHRPHGIQPAELG